MIGYILFNYVASEGTWCEFKKSCSLKSLKNYVIAERSENKMLMPLMIFSEATGKVVKKYKELVLECIN